MPCYTWQVTREESLGFNWSQLSRICKRNELPGQWPDRQDLRCRAISNFLSPTTEVKPKKCLECRELILFVQSVTLSDVFVDSCQSRVHSAPSAASQACAKKNDPTMRKQPRPFLQHVQCFSVLRDPRPLATQQLALVCILSDQVHIISFHVMASTHFSSWRKRHYWAEFLCKAEEF